MMFEAQGHQVIFGIRPSGTPAPDVMGSAFLATDNTPGVFFLKFLYCLQVSLLFSIELFLFGTGMEFII